MKNVMSLMAAGAAFAALPVAAQLNVGGAVDTSVAAQPGAIVGDTVNQVTKPVGDVVDHADHQINQTIDETRLSVAAREDVRAGAQITDMNGASLGTVQSVEGDMAVIVDGGQLYNVPLSSLYRNAANQTGALVSKVAPTAIEAEADAEVEAEAR